MDEALMNSLSASTKLIPKPGLLESMRAAGSAAADRFLETGAKDIGLRDSYDISKLFR